MFRIQEVVGNWDAGYRASVAGPAPAPIYVPIGDTVQSSLSVGINPEYVAALASGSVGNGFADGVLTPEEMASSDEAAGLAAAMQTVICEQLGLADCSKITITGIGNGNSGQVFQGVQLSLSSAYHESILDGAGADGVPRATS
jgi:hypothetical protein